MDLNLHFIKENDFDYMIVDDIWLDRVINRLTPEEIRPKIRLVLIQFMKEIEKYEDGIPNEIIEKVCVRGAERTLLIHLPLPLLDFAERREIETAFFSTLLRHILLKEFSPDTSVARQEFKERMLGDYSEFMFGVNQDEKINEYECTLLFRFERAILLAKRFINGQRNKGLLLSVGNVLESTEPVRYITGGNATRETTRRVKLIEHLFQIVKRKRNPKPKPLSHSMIIPNQPIPLGYIFEKSFDLDLGKDNKLYFEEDADQTKKKGRISPPNDSPSPEPSLEHLSISEISESALGLIQLSQQQNKLENLAVAETSLVQVPRQSYFKRVVSAEKNDENNADGDGKSSEKSSTETIQFDNSRTCSVETAIPPLQSIDSIKTVLHKISKATQALTDAVESFQALISQHYPDVVNIVTDDKVIHK